ncbi:MAG: hypothetical protein CVU46_10140 [Chloroflexi bacterium HGW-Chloroflexi-8]|jgi:uncharacterized membrane protein YkoI|nr:MAG: hypothetical protein CVU46_10140 [Chloroflexi bacterium HGW-Chloroflexi-8]
MNKRVVLFTSILLSVLLLVVIGGVVKTVTARQSQAAVNPDLQAQIDAREAEYAAQIEAANQQIRLLSDQVQGQQQVKVSSNISPENAASIALQTAGEDESLLQLPELVSYEGKTAYEVKLTDGVLFIDSISGEILFNGVPERITPEQAAEIAGVYLGGMDPRYATVQIAVSNGSEVFKVTFNDYIVFVDKFGNVVQAQVLQYTNASTSSSNSSSSGQASYSGYEDDHEEHDDDD